MKYFTICLLVLGLSQCQTNAFITGIISGAVGHVNNTINSVSNAADLASLGGQFLWDNSLKPTLDVLQNNGLNFIDNHFGGILNAIGKREVNLKQSEIEFVKSKYMDVSNGLIQSTKEMLQDFFTKLIRQMELQVEGLIAGETTVKKIVTKLIKNLKVAVDQLFQVAAQNFKECLNDSKFVLGKMESFIISAIDIVPHLLTNGN